MNKKRAVEQPTGIKSNHMSSSFNDSVAAPVQSSDDGSVVQGYVPGGRLSPDHLELSSFHSKVENGTQLEGDYMASDRSIFPPMQPEQGFALREWIRQNASCIEEKENLEKELLNQIIDEADGYKISFHSKRKTVCDSNIETNRESEKIYLAARDKFHAEADKNHWKAIADLVPKEVPVIETRGGKKDEDKKPSVVVLQGPKPGKPTDLSRMRQILIKLKHNSPLHLKHSPSPPAAVDATAPPPAHVAVA